jgi:hypothetical protein
MSVRSGDTVATGPASSALIRLRGSLVQLDENTDPSFFEHARNYLGCTLSVVLNIGQMDVDAEGTCLSGGGASFLSGSRFNLKIVPGGAVLTVTEGKVVIWGTERASVAAGTQASILDGRIVEQHRISAAELRSTIGWRERYTFAPASSGPARSQPAFAGYGALAHDEESGKYGLSSNEENQRKADDVAMEKCGTGKCTIVFRTVPRECGAIAFAEGGTAWGASQRPERVAAELAAVNTCQKRTKSQCKVREAGCNR